MGPSWVSFLPKSSTGVAVLAELHRVSEATSLGTCGLCTTEPLCIGACERLPGSTARAPSRLSSGPAATSARAEPCRTEALRAQGSEAICPALCGQAVAGPAALSAVVPPQATPSPTARADVGQD